VRLRRFVYVTVSDSDRELVAALRQGEPRAVDAVFAREHGRVLSYLTRMSGRRDVAEDLLQETFLRLVKHAQRLAEDTRIEVWLLSVARNLCRSQFRSGAVERDRNSQLARLPRPPSAASPHDSLEHKELSLRLDAALQTLSFEHREVLILLVVETLPQAAVAELLGLSHDALRQRFSRARKQLAEKLDKAPASGSHSRKVMRDAG
jgi:RNA polymerase sigma-70 factor (ECF subfamily)